MTKDEISVYETVCLPLTKDRSVLSSLVVEPYTWLASMYDVIALTCSLRPEIWKNNQVVIVINSGIHVHRFVYVHMFFLWCMCFMTDRQTDRQSVYSKYTGAHNHTQWFTIHYTWFRLYVYMRVNTQLLTGVLKPKRRLTLHMNK